MSKFLVPMALCGLAVLQTVRVEALAAEGDAPAKPTAALRAPSRKPLALDSQGKVLPHPIPPKSDISAILGQTIPSAQTSP